MSNYYTSDQGEIVHLCRKKPCRHCPFTGSYFDREMSVEQVAKLLEYDSHTHINNKNSKDYTKVIFNTRRICLNTYITNTSLDKDYLKRKMRKFIGYNSYDCK